MPIYVYKGLETGNYYEFEQGFHDEPLKAHPETGEPLKRVITPPGHHLQGLGLAREGLRQEGLRRQEGRGFGHQQGQGGLVPFLPVSFARLARGAFGRPRSGRGRPGHHLVPRGEGEEPLPHLQHAPVGGPGGVDLPRA